MQYSLIVLLIGCVCLLEFGLATNTTTTPAAHNTTTTPMPKTTMSTHNGTATPSPSHEAIDVTKLPALAWIIVAAVLVVSLSSHTVSLFNHSRCFKYPCTFCIFMYI
jgi:hypothetical protein